MELKTSKEWFDSVKDEMKLQILDPDGWDRSNFNYSFYEEKINSVEFFKRLSISTIRCDMRKMNDKMGENI